LASVVGRTFTFDFAGPPDAVWAAMADTARYNEASGLPRHAIESVPREDGTVRFVGRGRIGRFDLEWDDLPCNWVRERWFEHRRRFTKGPFRRLDARLDLEPLGAGCRARYLLEVEPAGLVGRALLAGGFFATAERGFRRLAGQADEFARSLRERPFDPAAPPRLPAPCWRGWSGCAASSTRRPTGTGWANASRATCARRARSTCNASGRWRWRGPGTCPGATRSRPASRPPGGPPGAALGPALPALPGAKATSPGLDGLPTGAHCPTCNIDYGRDFSANVELAFRPAEALRAVPAGEFCLLGPMSTPHICAHVTLAPAEERAVDPELDPGPYRLRTLEPGPEASVDFAGGPFPAAEILADGEVHAAEPSPPGLVACATSRPANARS
jgi:hypothetical protein